MSQKIRRHLQSPLAPQLAAGEGFYICSLTGHGWLATREPLTRQELPSDGTGGRSSPGAAETTVWRLAGANVIGIKVTGAR